MAGYKMREASPTKDAKMKGAPKRGKKAGSKMAGAKSKCGRFVSK